MLTNIPLHDIIKMPLWDGEDFFSIVFRFAIHFSVVLLIVRGLYYQINRRRDYLFTYILLSTVIFLLCFLLENVKLELGMALGLFAVFGIIRYRTSQIPIKEMTYLFIVIALAVINALANKKISISELMLTNAIVVLITWSLEKLWTVQHVSRKVIQYDKISLIKPENYNILLEDLKNRLGLDITKIEVGRVDFLRDTAKLVVYYEVAAQDNNMADDIEEYSAEVED